MHHLSVLTARPHSMLFPSASFAGCAGLMVFVSGDDRSTPTSIGHTSATPLATSAHGDHCSTSSLVLFMDYASYTCLPLALGACLHVTSSPPSASADDTCYATPPYLSASTLASMMACTFSVCAP